MRALVLFFLISWFANPIYAQPANCNLLCNTDFEDAQLVNAGLFGFFDQNLVLCWKTTEADSLIEVWGTGFNGVPSYSGNQFIELNAYTASTLYQDFQAIPNTSVQVSFAHRGRSGTDTMRVEIGPVGGPYANLGDFAAGTTAWVYSTVNYTFPNIPGTNYSLRFTAVYAAGGVTAGNFLDAISIMLPHPVITSTINNPTCPFSTDGSIAVNMSSGNPPYAISWGAPLSSSNPSVNGLSQGNYSVEVTDGYGCVTTQSFTLSDQFPNYQLNVYNYICDGDSVVSGTNVYTQSGVYINNLQSVNGCDSIVTLSLQVNPVYNSYSNISICPGQTYTLPDGTVVNSSGTYTSTFQTVNGCDSVFTTIVNVTPVYSHTDSVTICDGSSYTLPDGSVVSSSGQYPFTYTSTAGCDSIVITMLTMNPSPVAGFSVDSLCAGMQVDFINQTNSVLNSFTSQWSFGDLSFSSALNPLHTYFQSGQFTVTLLSVDTFGCSDTIIKTIEVQAQPSSSFIADKLSGCAELPVNFTNQQQGVPIASYSWDFSSAGTSTAASPYVLFTVPGRYTVSLTVISTNGCASTTKNINYIDVSPTPVASFNYQAYNKDSYYPVVNFTDLSSSANQWLWDFGDNTYSTDQNPDHIYSGYDNYDVQLIAINNSGCTDTTYGVVDIQSSYSIWIPNSFTPDGDGVNDLFLVSGFGISDIQLNIFNRWGEKIFQSSNSLQGWNGTFNGEPVKMDVYVYKVSLVDDVGEEHEFTGKVTVIR